MRTQRIWKPWIFGIVLAILVVFAEAFLKVYPPSAYSFCLTGHTRDLVNGLINRISGTDFPQTLLSRRIIILTSPAVFLGAFVAARWNRERHPRKADTRIRSFFLGFTVMLVGLAIFGCPTRIIIRAGYGEWYGIMAFFGLIVGVLTTTAFLKWRSGRIR